MKIFTPEFKESFRNHATEIYLGSLIIIGAASYICIASSRKDDTGNDRLVALDNDQWGQLASGGIAKIDSNFGHLWITKEYHLE